MRCEIGVDIVAMTRIEQAVERFGERFLKRIYTPEELEYALGDAHKWEHLAARFAAKEAASKALGTGMVGVGWKDFAVERLRSGKPMLRLTGRAVQLAQDQGLTQWSVSLAHDADAKVAVAMVVAWGNGDMGIKSDVDGHLA
ncbi:MAG: holo-ACP synthase [Chloroflexota bacterium]